MPYPRIGQVVDENNVPVSGALIYVYDPSDDIVSLTSDGVTSTGNPLTTDQFGAYTYYTVSAGVFREDTYYGNQLRYRERVAIGLGASNEITVTAANGYSVSSRALLAGISIPVTGQSATLTESGREGTFVFDSADHSAHVTADPNQGIYVAPSSDTTGASGAWVRHPGIDTWVLASWFGTPEDGVTDATAKLQSALSFGKPVVLKNNKISTYLIASGLDHVAGSGLVCLDGRATIKAKTGTGGFSATSAMAPRTGLDRNMFRCNGTDDVTLRNIHFTTDGASEVFLCGFRIMGGMATVGYDVSGISFSGFFNGLMVEISSVGSGRKRLLDILSAVDSGITQGLTRFADGAQTSVVEIDNDLIASTPSAPGTIRIGLIKNILYTGQALTDFGQQTDGVNIVCQGANSTSDWDIEIGVIDGVGEPLDLQAFNCNVRVGTIRNAYNFGVKLIHGASGNAIDVGTVVSSGEAAVYVSGSASAACDRNTSGNTVKIGTVINPGSYGLGPAAGYAVLFAATISTHKPTNNVVEIGNIVGDGVNLDNVVSDGGIDVGNKNLVIIGKASGFVGASVVAPPGNVRVKYLGRCFADLSMSAGQVITTATDTKLAFDTVVTDTESIAVTASNRFTIIWPGLYRLTASVRMDGWSGGAATDQWKMALRQNVTEVQTAKGKINFAPGTDESGVVTGTIYVAENVIGTTACNLEAWFEHNIGADRTISNVIGMTRFTIERVG